jgi:acyl carrier protein
MVPDVLLLEGLKLDSLDRVDRVIMAEGDFTFKIREEETIRKICTLGGYMPDCSLTRSAV